MRVTARFHQSSEVAHFLRNLSGPKMLQAGAQGLTEHAQEQRRQSVVRITASTGIPASRIRSKTTVSRARAGPNMSATVQTADQAIPLSEYGNPAWQRDLNPGWKGGAVSSSRGAQATAWNVRRTFAGTWVAKGHVFRRENPNDNRSRPVRLYAATLANELAKPTRPNVPAAAKFAQLDLEKRVVRHVLRALGT